MSSKRDYYEILGVTRQANEQELKQAYRRLAVQYHPDKNPGDHTAEEKFKEINEAYQVLSQPELRSRYDRYGHAGVGAAAGAGAGFGQGFPGFEDIFEMFGFGEMFGGQGRRRGPQPGSDLRHDIQITLEEAARGVRTKIRVPRMEHCETCHGSGAAEGSQPVRCTTCGGSGQVRYQQAFLSVLRTCSACRGTGKVIKNHCRACHGAGRIEREKTLEINIPAGIDNGSPPLRSRGEGDVGDPGAARGDLYVIVHVKKHDVFERHGAHLRCTIPISFTQAALGGEIRVPTLDGEEHMKIEEGTQTSTTFRLKGKGMPVLGGRGRGDLYAEVSVVTPTSLTREQRKLLEELARLERENPADDRGIIDKVKDIFG